MRKYGLIGRSLGHSYSREHFLSKFLNEGIADAQYELYPLDEINEFPGLIEREKLLGINVTIPYKESVIPFLDEVDASAEAVGAVNVIKTGTKLRGYNTDRTGFKKSLIAWLPKTRLEALVLGTGGASKAVVNVLQELAIPYLSISRTSGDMTYGDLRNQGILSDRKLIINTTPLGMHPDTGSKPDLDYNLLGSEHFLYDLVYNPEETSFMAEGIKRGAQVKNGLEMLYLQAEEAWRIWND